jgi:hypothetical protein
MEAAAEHPRRRKRRDGMGRRQPRRPGEEDGPQK